MAVLAEISVEIAIEIVDLPIKIVDLPMKNGDWTHAVAVRKTELVFMETGNLWVRICESILLLSTHEFLQQMTETTCGFYNLPHSPLKFHWLTFLALRFRQNLSWEPRPNSWLEYLLVCVSWRARPLVMSQLIVLLLVPYGTGTVAPEKRYDIFVLATSKKQRRGMRSEEAAKNWVNANICDTYDFPIPRGKTHQATSCIALYQGLNPCLHAYSIHVSCNIMHILSLNNLEEVK